ncbi:uncharacterized protein LOC142566751 isoform X4 [Dermacentor variabilis]|uniref:uncharacterized protein LOC142566751 isoform X4 n=1 Tax=Dermacentor variabilis TaxID=34621 RepID=UPI003F5BABB6
MEHSPLIRVIGTQRCSMVVHRWRFTEAIMSAALPSKNDTLSIETGATAIAAKWRWCWLLAILEGGRSSEAPRGLWSRTTSQLTGQKDATGSFTNSLTIRFHPSLELEGDEIKTLVCKFTTGDVNLG